LPRHQSRSSTSCRQKTAPAFSVNPAVLPKYAGNYRDAASGLTMTVTVQNGALMGQVQGQPAVRLVPNGGERLSRRRSERDVDVQRARRAGRIDWLVQGPRT
jgi:hypothetical protein